MELKFTPHPFLQPPTDEEIVLLAEKDPKLLEALYLSHEGRLQASEEDIVPCESWSVGWIQEDTDEYLRLYTGFYEDGIELADKIVIPKGCIVKIDNLKVTSDFFDD